MRGKISYTIFKLIKFSIWSFLVINSGYKCVCINSRPTTLNLPSLLMDTPSYIYDVVLHFLVEFLHCVHVGCFYICSPPVTKLYSKYDKKFMKPMVWWNFRATETKNAHNKLYATIHHWTNLNQQTLAIYYSMHLPTNLPIFTINDHFSRKQTVKLRSRDIKCVEVVLIK